MSGRLASKLCDFAAALLPASRKGWGDAMRAELAYIGSERSALVHSVGCIMAAVKERAMDFDARFAAGIWSVALVTAALAIFHLRCAWRGLEVLMGDHDGFLAGLTRCGRADIETIARYHSAIPVVATCLFCLGLAHLAAGYFLVRMQIKRVCAAWLAALLLATLAVFIQLSIVWSPPGLPSEYYALLLQAAALPALLLWSNGRHRRQRRTG
jgi:hypothetical protein